MKSSSVVKFLTCLVALFCTSCSTVMHGPNQKIFITSQPENACIYIDGNGYGRTPTVAKLERKHNHYVRIELPGYEPYETVLDYKLSSWFFGNILVGGIPGMVIDAVTGAMYKLTPSQICAELAKDNALTFSDSGDQLMVAVTLKADPNWEQIGTLQKR